MVPRTSEHQRGRIIQLAGSAPPGRLQQGGEGLGTPEDPEAPAHWTLDALAQAAQAEGIRVGRSQVRRILLAEGARWRQPRSWTHSTDPEFVPKGGLVAAVSPPGACRAVVRHPWGDHPGHQDRDLPAQRPRPPLGVGPPATLPSPPTPRLYLPDLANVALPLLCWNREGAGQGLVGPWRRQSICAGGSEGSAYQCPGLDKPPIL